MAKKTRYSDEDKQKHIEATKGFTLKLLAEYAATNGLSVNTLRGWHVKKDKSGKPGKRRGRPPGSKASLPQPGPQPGKRRGRPPGSKAKTVAPVQKFKGGGVKSDIADFLLSTDQGSAEDAASLLKRAYAVL